MYTTIAVMFVVNLYGATLTTMDYIGLVFFLTLITKSIASLPSGAVVVFLASATQLGLPAKGVALLVYIDFFVNAERTVLNVVGNALAPVIIEETERQTSLNVTYASEKQETVVTVK